VILHRDCVLEDPFDLASLVNQIFSYQRLNQERKDPNDLASFGESVSSHGDRAQWNCWSHLSLNCIYNRRPERIRWLAPLGPRNMRFMERGTSFALYSPRLQTR